MQFSGGFKSQKKRLVLGCIICTLTKVLCSGGNLLIIPVKDDNSCSCFSGISPGGPVCKQLAGCLFTGRIFLEKAMLPHGRAGNLLLAQKNISDTIRGNGRKQLFYDLVWQFFCQMLNYGRPVKVFICHLPHLPGAYSTGFVDRSGRRTFVRLCGFR